MRLISRIWSRIPRSSGRVHFNRLMTRSVSAALLAACGGGGAESSPADESPPQASLSQKICDLLPQPDAERIMGKALVQQRNDDWACHYQDAQGTTGTSLFVDVNVLTVSDQCRLISDSEPLSGVGEEACIAIGRPTGIYSTIVFRGGGRTFEVKAPGQDKASELATATAKVILAKLGT